MKRQLAVLCLVSVLLVAVVLVSCAATSGKAPVAEPAGDIEQALSAASYSPVCVGEGTPQLYELSSKTLGFAEFYKVFVMTPPSGCGYPSLYCVFFKSGYGGGLDCTPVAGEGEGQ